MLTEIKKDIVKIGSLMYRTGLTTATGGCIGVREGKYIIVTPHAACFKEFELLTDNLLVLDVKTERVIEGSGKPSTCVPVFLRIFREFPETKGIIHGHPLYLTYFAIVGETVPAIASQTRLLVGDVPVVKSDVSMEENYPMWLEKMALGMASEIKKRREELKKHGVAINLYNHAPFAVGKSLEEAHITLESAEESAKIFFLTKLLKNHKNH